MLKTTNKGRRPPPLARSLAGVAPHLVAELHPSKNGDLAATDVYAGNNALRLWWQCSRGHEWRTTPRARIKGPRGTGTGCPVCPRSKVSPQQSLAACHPDIAATWHPTMNQGVTPADVASQSNRHAWWKCECGREWASTVRERVHSKSAPQCSRCRPVSPKQPEKDLSVARPDLAAQLHREKNCGVDLGKVSAGSNRVLWWRCVAGHEWQAKPIDRVRAPGNCPYCTGRRLTPERTLQARYPEVAAEWASDLNAGLSPTDVSYASNRRVMWRCVAGHTWSAKICKRTGARPTGCPDCVSRRTSQPELSVRSMLAEHHTVSDNAVLVVSNWRFHCDIILPDLHTVVEYDGFYWHERRVREDKIKTTKLVNAGWRVIRMREAGLPCLAEHVHVGSVRGDVNIDGRRRRTALRKATDEVLRLLQT